ncbi:hypothetical protein HHK36_017639 [Tetracentron sinense]|uniref:Dirigent protein n=1 Tax=Tetracentron sinense TaxID=13715 RepID=A0A834YXG9_TETSI|nr:hypothetical protein HHK36_017639 [Tetracentron sinense]
MAGAVSRFTIFYILFFYLNIAADGTPNSFSKVQTPAKFGFKKEKLSHLHFYFHDTISGHNISSIRIISGPSKKSSVSKSGFGNVYMSDDPLTEGPDIRSKLVGRAQGMYAYASQNELGLLMVLNFAFMEGKYNGSTLSMLGRNMALSEVREMPVVGGSGLFRFARGYFQAKTHTFNRETAVVEYNVYVLHY